VTSSNLEDAPKGVIFCLKDLTAATESPYSSNAIYPYNLCYVNQDGQIFIPGNNPKRCLDYFKKLCLGKQEVFHDLVAAFDRHTAGGKHMEMYSRLLQTVIPHLKGIDDEIGLDTLAIPGGTRLQKSTLNNMYELIAYLIIQ
jgi:hypothetical protein